MYRDIFFFATTLGRRSLLNKQKGKCNIYVIMESLLYIGFQRVEYLAELYVIESDGGDASQWRST